MVLMTNSTPFYTSETGKGGSIAEDLSADLLSTLGFSAEQLTSEEDAFLEEWCHVCGRPTDHRGEHDDLVEANLAAYSSTEGVVYNLEHRS
jgi:hypothetical protein